MTGVQKVTYNLRKSIKKIEGTSMAGLFEAALLILREAKIKTPVDLGNLWNSGYIVASSGDIENETPTFVQDEKAGKKRDLVKMTSDHLKNISEDAKLVSNPKRMGVIIGFSAYYAMIVHEDVTMRHTRGEALFLQKAIQRNRKRILEIIRDRAEVL